MTTTADLDLLPMPRWRRRVISALILFHLIAIPLAAPIVFQSTMNTSVMRFFRTYVYGLRIRQYWALFSPEPRRYSVKYSAEITFQDGTKKTWRRPYPPKWDFFARHHSYSFQKWDLVDEYLDQRSPLWDSLVHFLRVNYDDPYNHPDTIRFIRSRADWPPPNPTGWVGGEEKDLVWKDQDLFTYVVRTGEFR